MMVFWIPLMPVRFMLYPSFSEFDNRVGLCKITTVIVMISRKIQAVKDILNKCSLAEEPDFARPRPRGFACPIGAGSNLERG